MRVVQGATKFEILKKKIATGFAKAERGKLRTVRNFFLALAFTTTAKRVFASSKWHKSCSSTNSAGMVR